MPLSFFTCRPALLTASLLAAFACHAAPAIEIVPAAEPNKVLSKLNSFTDHATNLAIQAISLIGIHYQRGGTSPEHGLDCSGLVRYVFKEAWGADLPRTSAEISRMGENIDKQDLQPGDLVFFNTLKHTFSHVGIYLGDNKFIHSPSAGGKCAKCGKAYQ